MIRPASPNDSYFGGVTPPPHTLSQVSPLSNVYNQDLRMDNRKCSGCVEHFILFIYLWHIETLMLNSVSSIASSRASLYESASGIIILKVLF